MVAVRCSGIYDTRYQNGSYLLPLQERMYKAQWNLILKKVILPGFPSCLVKMLLINEQVNL